MNRLSYLVAFLLVLLVSASRAQDGIYADFATSMGNFTCQLHYDRAPRTVANFMTLAEGSRAWLDLPTGDAKRTPYYNGLIFHRVSRNFVIQGGSPKGDGSDGPGYSFKDEFHPLLRHSGEGVLSMANSGLHSNGSQFFVTLAATPSLNDVHSVFGNVTSGIEVVRAIGAVDLVGGSQVMDGKPVTPVVMNSVTIRRVGAAAQSFDVQTQGLPTVGSAAPVLQKNGVNLALQFTRSLNSEYAVYDSADLVSWNRQAVGLYTQPPPAGNWDVSATANQTRHFYRVPRVSYPDTLLTPASVAGGTLTLNLSSGDQISYTFAATGNGGTCIYTPPSGSANSTSGAALYSWTQEAYRGRAVLQSENVIPIVASFAFSSAGSGVFRGTAYPNNPNPSFTVVGTFTYYTHF